MSLVDFELPKEFQGVTADIITQEMLDGILKEYDKTEGGFVFDMIRPSALETAELIQYWLVLGLMTMSHIWAKGRWLDYHAHDCGLVRRPATYAFGNVEVTTTEPITFPQGFIFSVPSENGSAAIDFETVEEHIFNAAGTETIRVKAVLSGTGSNVKAESITIMKNPLSGVEKITNPESMMGGTIAEDDDSLRQRIDDFYAGRMASFVGNKKDYQRWAKEVAGVGYAHCIPIYDGPNTVKVVVADLNGEPANQEILDAVELHIFGTGHKDLNRLAPIGIVKYAVVAPTLIAINYAFDVKLARGYTVEQIEELLRENLKTFYKTLADDENYFAELKYVAVSAVILNTEGIEDFKHLRINGAIGNVDFGEENMPSTGELRLTLYDTI